MITQYLDSLEKSMIEKSSILSNLTSMSEKQKEIVSSENVDWDAFDKLVDEKGELVDKLDGLDTGFEAVYDRIKDELNANKDKYKDKIISIQNLIAEVTEKSTSLMALEERNKNIITNSINTARQKINSGKVNSRVASNYYKTMSKVNYIDPQLMDKKK